MDFTPERLILARRRRSLTLAQVSRLAKLTPTTLTAFENGRARPSQPSLAAVSTALGFPERFFAAPALTPLPSEATSLHGHTKISARSRGAALATATLAASLNSWLENRVRMPEPDIPRLPNASPERAAEAVRTRWNLGHAPIPHLIGLLEEHGARVFTLPPDCAKTPLSYAAFHRDTPFIFLTPGQPHGQLRLEAARALGHLVLHPVPTRGVDARTRDSSARKFAACFLMPPSAIEAEMLRDPSPQRIATERQPWGVTAVALATRLNDLGLLPAWPYRGSLKTLSQLDATDTSSQPESSRLLPWAFKTLQNQGLSPQDMADEVLLPLRELNYYTFGADLLAHASLQGQLSSLTLGQQTAARGNTKRDNR